MQGMNFSQVDVFALRSFEGNPVAVILDARGLTSEKMQAIANWTNLSETTFVLPPEDPVADYRVRIFTPVSELPFAGHPTIGTAHALLEAGLITTRDGRLVQECGAGLVTLHISGSGTARTIAFELPAPTITPLSALQAARLANCLDCHLDHKYEPALIDVGARWIVAGVTDVQTLLSVSPDYARLKYHDSEAGVTGICLYAMHNSDEQNMIIEVRSFAPSCGVNEDPVCGSGNGSVAAFLRHHRIPVPADGQITSHQGQSTGRNGVIHLTVKDGLILVGGQAVSTITGIISAG